MEADLIEVGKCTPQYSKDRTRILKYSTPIAHHGLGEEKIITAQDTDLLREKLATQVLKWKDKWKKEVEQQLKATRKLKLNDEKQVAEKRFLKRRELRLTFLD